MDELNTLLYILNHVFLPPKLPREDDSGPNNDTSLCRFVCEAARKFTPQIQQNRWSVVRQMLEMLFCNTKVRNKDMIVKDILGLKDGGLFLFWCATLFDTHFPV